MIEFDVGGRQIGKTTRILQWMVEKDDPRTICICHSQKEVMRLRNLVGDKGLPLLPEQFKSVTGMRYLKDTAADLAIDNLDMMLYYLFGVNVERITATGIDLAKVVE